MENFSKKIVTLNLSSEYMPKNYWLPGSPTEDSTISILTVTAGFPVGSLKNSKESRIFAIIATRIAVSLMEMSGAISEKYQSAQNAQSSVISAMTEDGKE